MSADTAAVAVEVIVLNGASSSGKTTIADALQDLLDDSWLIFGIDTLISALPLSLLDMHEDAIINARPREHDVHPGGISFGADGEISVGPEFRRLEAAWRTGLSTIAGTGTRLILDEVFLEGARSQDRLREALAGRTVAWVGVTCDTDTAIQREQARGDRVIGQFERQNQRVHDGVHYDLVVDTTSQTADEAARQIVERLFVAAP